MQNQVQKGDAVYVTAPSGGFVSGKGYQVGSALFGVAGFSCNSGSTGVLWTVGVYNLTKTSAESWSVGDVIYWDNTNFRCDNVANTGTRIGVALSTAANPSSVGEVRLNGFLG